MPLRVTIASWRCFLLKLVGNYLLSRQLGIISRPNAGNGLLSMVIIAKLIIIVLLL